MRKVEKEQTLTTWPLWASGFDTAVASSLPGLSFPSLSSCHSFSSSFLRSGHLILGKLPGLGLKRRRLSS